MSDNDAGKNEAATPGSPGERSLGERFGWEHHDWIIILVVVLLVGARVVTRGFLHTSEGLLKRPLRVGIVAWPGYAGGLMANNGIHMNKDSDFWVNRNLLVEFVPEEDETKLHQDFALGGDKGGLDIIWSTVDSLAHQYPSFLKDGVTPRAIMQVDWSRGGDAIVAVRDIRSIEQLKNRKIAVSNAASLWLLEYSLEHSGLTETERTAIRNQLKIVGGSDQARQEFEERTVDVAVLWEPDVSHACEHRLGAHILLDTSTATHLIADVMVANEDFIQKHPTVIDAFIKGWLLDGTPKALNDPMRTATVLQEERTFKDLGPEKTRELLGKVALATLQDNEKMFGPPGSRGSFDTLFEAAGNVWLSHGYITSLVQSDQAQDVTLLKEIYSSQTTTPALTGCGSPVQTSSWTIPFQANSATLTPAAKRILDGNDVTLLITVLSEANFCIEIEGSNQESASRRALRQARIDSVIQYLVLHYNRPRKQFITTEDTHGNNALSGSYIRLKLTDVDESENGPAAQSSRNTTYPGR
jgi:NitT/TauT family transport system substrate-binding protein